MLIETLYCFRAFTFIPRCIAFPLMKKKSLKKLCPNSHAFWIYNALLIFGQIFRISSLFLRMSLNEKSKGDLIRHKGQKVCWSPFVFFPFKVCIYRLDWPLKAGISSGGLTQKRNISVSREEDTKYYCNHNNNTFVNTQNCYLWGSQISQFWVLMEFCVWKLRLVFQLKSISFWSLCNLSETNS